MSRTASRLALAFALLGLAASTAALYTHYRLLTDPSYLSVCDVNETVSCSQVYASQYGTVRGVSVAVFGAAWFGLAALLGLAGLRARASVQESVGGYLFAGSTLALSAVIYLGYASFVLLHLVCLFCLVTYVAAIGLFLVSGAASSTPLWSLPRRALADVAVLVRSPLALLLTAAFAGSVVSAVAYFPRESQLTLSAGEGSETERVEFERWYTSQPRMALNVPADGARVLVVEFSDYQCPYCRQAYLDYREVFARFEASYPGAVRLVHKDFPLEKECNDAMSSDMHPWACEGAAAVRLAGAQGRGAAMGEWLFANQPEMTPDMIREGARQVGQVEGFDLHYAEALEGIRADVAYARELGVTSTPTYFLNGVKVEGGLPPHLFEQAITYELQRAGVELR